jgi:hypothetical protein
MLFDYEFTGRRPSAKQVKKIIAQAVSEGYPLINISWGENQIMLENNLEFLRGSGWIKNIGGDDLAQEFNNNRGF